MRYQDQLREAKEEFDAWDLIGRHMMTNSKNGEARQRIKRAQKKCRKCDKQAHSKGLCSAHYQQSRRRVRHRRGKPGRPKKSFVPGIFPTATELCPHLAVNAA